MKEKAVLTGPKAPPFDLELVDAAEFSLDAPVIVTPGLIPIARSSVATTADDYLDGRPIQCTEFTALGPDGGADIALSVFERVDRAPGGPAIYYIHGGGLILGNRYFGLAPILDWVTDLDAMLVSVEYRLAPEHPYPAPFDDCFAGLRWLAERQAEFGYDPNRLAAAGASAGGGLAAGVALKACDLGGPDLAAQVLIYPMLDDRNNSVASRQFDGIGRWDRTCNDTGWDAYLGERRRAADVPVYAAPGRATNLSNLPPTFIDAGSAEVFRDEDVAYASQIWADGGVCELHIWPGGYHAFDMHTPNTALARAMMQTRTAWLARALHRPDGGLHATADR